MKFLKTPAGLIITALVLLVAIVAITYNWDAIKAWFSSPSAPTTPADTEIPGVITNKIVLYNSDGVPLNAGGGTGTLRSVCGDVDGDYVVPYPAGSQYYGYYYCVRAKIS